MEVFTQPLEISVPGVCECGEPYLVDQVRGQNVCTACGCVGSPIYRYDPGKYDSEMVNSTFVRPWENGHRTRVGHMGGWDRPNVQSTAWYRMAYLNSSATRKRDQHYRRTMPEIFRVAGILQFSGRMLDQVLYFYNQAFINFTKDKHRFKNRKAMILVAFYLVIRDNEIPMSLQELIDTVSDLPLKPVKYYLNMYRKELKYRMKPINVPYCIMRFGDKLILPYHVISTAIRLYHDLHKDRVFGGSNPYVITAGILWYVATRNASHRTKRLVADTCEVSTYSLRDIVKRIERAQN